METRTTCSWCHTSNPTTEHFCRQCGHAAHLPRLFCDCAACILPPAPEDGDDDPHCSGKENTHG
jgi:hypothetical protein